MKASLSLTSARPFFRVEPQHRTDARTSQRSPPGLVIGSAKCVGLGWHSSSGDGILPTMPLPPATSASWISSSSPPPPPPHSRKPTTPPVSSPPSIQSPSASDADSSFAGDRAVDRPMLLRAEDAFPFHRKTVNQAMCLWNSKCSDPHTDAFKCGLACGLTRSRKRDSKTNNRSHVTGHLLHA